MMARDRLEKLVVLCVPTLPDESYRHLCLVVVFEILMILMLSKCQGRLRVEVAMPRLIAAAPGRVVEMDKVRERNGLRSGKRAKETKRLVLKRVDVENSTVNARQ